MSKSKEFKKIKRDASKNLNQIRKGKVDKDEKDELISWYLSELRTL